VVQAKVRDSKEKEQKTKRKTMTTEAYQWKNTLRLFTNGDFFQTFG